MQYEGYKTIPDFYDRVRSLLTTDSMSLPDAVIDYPENAPLAESMIKKRVSNWNDLEEDKILIFKGAVVYQTAIVCKSVSRQNEYKIAQTQSLKIEYNESTFDLDSYLNEKLDELLSEIEQISVSLMPIFEIS